eukprot:TRINITY_DN4290_c0_g1_i1.p1 TRINITY_DN4290_c0_g1~~TRINITY_DN4290_c0_g1_i1.p1  ORF type:complete len:2635 (+),score=748.88 TRINITY_DN4290_c0_g1_i1:981-7907(+)
MQGVEEAPRNAHVFLLRFTPRGGSRAGEWTSVRHRAAVGGGVAPSPSGASAWLPPVLAPAGADQPASLWQCGGALDSYAAPLSAEKLRWSRAARGGRRAQLSSDILAAADGQGQAPPPPRGECAVVCLATSQHPHGAVIVFGGRASYEQHSVLGDLWVFDLSTLAWTRDDAAAVVPAGSAEQSLQPRPPPLTPQLPTRADVSGPVDPAPLRFVTAGDANINVDWNNPKSVGAAAMARSLWSPSRDRTVIPASMAQLAGPASPRSPPGAGSQRSHIVVRLRPDPPCSFRKDVRVAYDGPSGAESPLPGLTQPPEVVAHMEGRHPYACNFNIRNNRAPGSQVTAFVHLFTDLDTSSVDIDLAEAQRGVAIRLRLLLTLHEAARQAWDEQRLAEREADRMRQAEHCLWQQREREREQQMERWREAEQERERQRAADAAEMERMRADERRRVERMAQLEQLEERRKLEREAERERERHAELTRQKSDRERQARELKMEQSQRECDVALRRLQGRDEEINIRAEQLDRELEAMAKERDTHQREREAHKYHAAQYQTEKKHLEARIQKITADLHEMNAERDRWEEEKADLLRKIEEAMQETKQAQLVIERREGRLFTDTDAAWAQRKARMQKDFELQCVGEYTNGALTLKIPTRAPEQVVYYCQGSGEPAPLAPVPSLQYLPGPGGVGEETEIRVSATLVSPCCPGDILVLRGTTVEDGIALRTSAAGTRVLLGQLTGDPSLVCARRRSGAGGGGLAPPPAASSNFSFASPVGLSTQGDSLSLMLTRSTPQLLGESTMAQCSVMDVRSNPLSVQLAECPRGRQIILTIAAPLAQAVENAEYFLSRLGFFTNQMDPVARGARRVLLNVKARGGDIVATRRIAVLAPMLTIPHPSCLQIQFVEGKGSMPLLAAACVEPPSESAPGMHPGAPPACVFCAKALANISGDVGEALSTGAPGGGTSAGCTAGTPLAPADSSQLVLQGGWLRVQFVRGWSSDDYILCQSAAVRVEPGGPHGPPAVQVFERPAGVLRAGSLNGAVAQQQAQPGAGREALWRYPPKGVVVIQLDNNVSWSDVQELIRALHFGNDSQSPARPRRLVEVALFAAQQAPPPPQAEASAPKEKSPASPLRKGPGAAKGRAQKGQPEPPLPCLDELPFYSMQLLEVSVISVDSPTEVKFLATDMVYCCPHEPHIEELRAAVQGEPFFVFRGATVVDEDTDEFDKGRLRVYIDPQLPGDMLEVVPHGTLRLETDGTERVAFHGDRRTGVIAPLRSGPVELHGGLDVDFGRCCATLESIEALLHCVAFRAFSEGNRQVMFELRVGECAVFCQRLSIHVRPAHLNIPEALQCANFSEGAEPASLGLFQPKHDPFPAALISFEITDGCEQGDTLEFRPSMAELRELGKGEEVRWPALFSARPEEVTRTEVVGDPGERVLAYCLRCSDAAVHILLPSPLPADQAQEVLRGVKYSCRSRDPRMLTKSAVITTTDLTCPQLPAVSRAAVLLHVEPVDDATEFLNVRLQRSYCPGSVEDNDGFALLPHALVYDPDTDDFSGGYVCAELLSGGDGSDTFSIMAPEAQHARYLATRSLEALVCTPQDTPAGGIAQPHPESVLSLHATGSLWLHRNIEALRSAEAGVEEAAKEAVHVGWIGGDPPPRGKPPHTACKSKADLKQMPSGADGPVNLTISFATNTAVSIQLAQQCAQVITFRCGAQRTDERAVLVRLNSAAGPLQEARVSLTIAVSQPVLLLPPTVLPVLEFAATMTDDGSGIPPPKPLASQVALGPGADPALLVKSGGWVAARLMQPCQGDRLELCTKGQVAASPFVVKEDADATAVFHGKNYIGRLERSDTTVCLRLCVVFDPERSAKVDAKVLQLLLRNLGYLFAGEPPLPQESRGAEVVHSLSGAPGSRSDDQAAVAVLVRVTPPAAAAQMQVLRLKPLPEQVVGGPPVRPFGGATLDSGAAGPAAWERGGTIELRLRSVTPDCVSGAEELACDSSVLPEGVTAKQLPGGVLKLQARGGPLAAQAGPALQSALRAVRYRVAASERRRRAVEVSLRLPAAENPAMSCPLQWIPLQPPIFAPGRSPGLVAPEKGEKCAELLPQARVELPPKRKALKGGSLVAELVSMDEVSAVLAARAPYGSEAVVADYMAMLTQEGARSPRRRRRQMERRPTEKRGSLAGLGRRQSRAEAAAMARQASANRMAEEATTPSFVLGKMASLKQDEVVVSGATIGKASGAATPRLVITFDAKKDVATAAAVQALVQSLQLTMAGMPTGGVFARIMLADKDGSATGYIVHVAGRHAVGGKWGVGTVPIPCSSY